jgi:chromosome segregation ATPase
MAEDRAALLAAVNEGDDVHAALRALRHAMAWSVSAVSSAPVPQATDPAAIELVLALDDALTQVDGLVAHVPALAEASMAGLPVTEYLSRQAQALAELADRVAVARREHEALAAVHAELLASSQEHDSISRELDELRRLQRLADALPELHEQRASLARRIEAMSSPIDDVRAAEQALLDTADTVVTLGAQRQADLNERVQELLATAARTEVDWAARQRQHADVEARLRETRTEYEKLDSQREGWLEVLRQHAEIDEDLFERLTAVRDDAGDGTATERVHTLLADVEVVLDKVDNALRDMLERHRQVADDNHRVLPWRDEP